MVEGDEVQVEQAFLACITEITQRVEKLKQLAQQNLDQQSLKSALVALTANN